MDQPKTLSTLQSYVRGTHRVDSQIVVTMMVILTVDDIGGGDDGDNDGDTHS